MVNVPQELVQYLVEKMVEKAGAPAGSGATEAIRSEYSDQVLSVLGALGEANFVPVWAKISTTGVNVAGQQWEASISRRSDHGGTAHDALSALWGNEVTHLPAPPRPCAIGGPGPHLRSSFGQS